MEKFNNPELDAINSRVCMRADEYEDANIESQGQTNSKVTHEHGTKEWLDYTENLKKAYSNKGLTEDEQNFIISLLHTYQVNYTEIAELIPAEVIANFCNVIDSNKKLPELYQTDKTETKKKLFIRFANTSDALTFKIFL